MKKLFALLSLISIGTMSALAYDLDANGLFRANLKTRLMPNESYVLNCPSIIENIAVEADSNVTFNYLDNTPFVQNEKRGANRLIIKTGAQTSSSFDIKMLDGNSETFKYKIDSKAEKNGAIVGVCRIEP